MTLWLIAHTPHGVRCWDLGVDELPDDVDALVAAAGLTVGLPADGPWVDTAGEWDLSLTVGQPHQTLLERATVADAAALRTVDPTRLAAYRQAQAHAIRATKVDAARAALAALDVADVADVLADLDPAVLTAAADSVNDLSDHPPDKEA